MSKMHRWRAVISVSVFASAVFLGTPSAAQFPCQLKGTVSAVCTKLATEPAPDKAMLSKVKTPSSPAPSESAHKVRLSWKASASLSSPLGDGEGYNLYRLNPDCSCTKINENVIKDSVNEDASVEPGRTYRYAATAVTKKKKGNTSIQEESGPSNVVEVQLPR
jgi:hypothetical protein